MLLTIDIGNSNTVLGVFRGEELIANWRLTTARAQTVDEYGVLTRNLFSLAGLNQEMITGVMISSVVPPMNWTLAEMSRVYLGKKALFVEPGVKTGMAVLVDNPMEVGADRIVNGVAAFHQFGGPCIVVDFGTAITFDVISAKCEYVGGVIAPGLGISSEALFTRAARLPRVEIKDPGKVIGTNTVTHAGRFVLRLGGFGGRHAHAHQGGAEGRSCRRGHGRTGTAGGAWVEAHPACRGVFDADGFAPDLGEEPAP